MYYIIIIINNNDVFIIFIFIFNTRQDFHAWELKVRKHLVKVHELNGTSYNSCTLIINTCFGVIPNRENMNKCFFH